MKKDEKQLYALAVTALRRCGFRWGMFVMVTGSDAFSMTLGALAKRLGAASVLMCCDSDEDAAQAEKRGLAVYRYGESVEDMVARVTGRRLFDIAFETQGCKKAYDVLLASVKRGGTVGILAELAEPYVYLVKTSVRSQIRFIGIHTADAGAGDTADALLRGGDPVGTEGTR